MAMQSSSQSFAREMSVPVFKASSAKADWAIDESFFDKGS
jgi:hypothetical protein